MVRIESVLVVEDDDLMRDVLVEGLRLRGFHMREAEGVVAALKEIQSLTPSAILVDYQLKDGTAFDLLDALRSQDLRIPVIVSTGHASIDLAVKAVKNGAEQFIPKPIDLAALDTLLQRVIANYKNFHKDAAHRLERARYDRDPFLGQNAEMLLLKKAATRVAEVSSTVLIQGETGTGKGVLARWLHKSGPRSDEPFIDLNCAGLSGELLESELFGHQKGSFTGAIGNKVGLLEAANRGTIFLDEIGDMEPMIQSKMLKVVEEKRFHRLGDVIERKVDVQIIAATHRDLKDLVAENKFRSDLYFRISPVRLRIPPLRERLDDLPKITDRLLLQLGADMRHGPLQITAEARRALNKYPWPGNIRELRNVLERAALLTEDGVIRETGLEFESTTRKHPAPSPAQTLGTLAEVERNHIVLMLEVENWNVPRAAQKLGIPRSSLYAKLRQYGLSSRASTAL